MRLALRDWVTVLNAVTTEDAYGNPIPDWGTATEAGQRGHGRGAMESRAAAWHGRDGVVAAGMARDHVRGRR
jgi:hypothetical protein